MMNEDMLYESDAYKESVLGRFPIHANEYIEQIRFLDSTHQFSTTEKLSLVEVKIENHMARGTFTDCDMCGMEAIW